MMVCAGIANTGYLGVPLARSLFDDRQAVGQAITYDVVVSATFLLLVAFAIGAAFGTLAGETPRERVRAFLVRNPPLGGVPARARRAERRGAPRGRRTRPRSRCWRSRRSASSPWA